MRYGKNTHSWHCDVTKGTGQEQVSQVSSINSQHVDGPNKAAWRGKNTSVLAGGCKQRAKYVIFCNVRDKLFIFFND